MRIRAKSTVHYVGAVEFGRFCFEHFDRRAVGEFCVFRQVGIPGKSLFVSVYGNHLVNNAEVTLTDNEAGVRAPLQGTDKSFTPFSCQPIGPTVADPFRKRVEQISRSLNTA